MLYNVGHRKWKTASYLIDDTGFRKSIDPIIAATASLQISTESIKNEQKQGNWMIVSEKLYKVSSFSLKIDVAIRLDRKMLGGKCATYKGCPKSAQYTKGVPKVPGLRLPLEN